MVNSTRVTLVRPVHSSVYGVYKTLRKNAGTVGIPKDREIKPPLGLLYLASALESIGADVTIIDAEPEVLSTEAIVEKVVASEPHYVGVTSTTPEFHEATDIIRYVKSCNPGIITMMGGAHVSALPEESLQDCPEIDYVVVGEGEESIKKIVMERPDTRIVVSEPIQDLNQLPSPARHLVNYEHYQFPEPSCGLVKTDALETSRGCPFRCAFCYHMHSKVRFRDVVKVVDEVELSHRQTGATLFNFFDDTFTLVKERAMAICDEIIRRDLGLTFYCFTRADTLSKELLEKMKQAGFVRITMGIESGNQEMLDRLRKGTKLEDYERAYRWMDGLGIETRGSFIIGGPFETHQTIEDSINFARKLPLYRIGVNILTPYPGTELYRIALNGEHGLRLLCRDWREFRRWGNSVVETDCLSASDLEYYQKKFLRRFYASRKVVFHHIKQFLKGNHSYFFFRPVIFAVVDRLVTAFAEFFRPHKFVPPSSEGESEGGLGQPCSEPVRLEIRSPGLPEDGKPEITSRFGKREEVGGGVVREKD